MSDSPTIESAEHRRQLLRFARATTERVLGGTKTSPPEKPNIKGRFGGAFVTFWKSNAIRGCVGTFAATRDVAATIEEVAKASLNDPRFATSPITAGELKDLEIEISILSDAAPTDDPLSLVPGEHGLVIRRGGQSGCFLPKVAAERGWSAQEVLANCCTMKAGLPADAWRSPDTEVLLFTAQVFSESHDT